MKFWQVFDNLTIHGIRYIFNSEMNKLARAFWLLICSISVCGLAFYATNLYIKLNLSPDINIRISEKFTNQIPFPAITICTPLYAKNNLAHFYNFTRDIRNVKHKLLNLSIEEQNYLHANVHVCNPSKGAEVDKQTPNRTEENIVKLIYDSSLSVTEALIQCGYKGFQNNCSRMFNHVLTNKGYCYSFNLQSMDTIFNKNEISSDFHCYKRSKIAKSMYLYNPLTNETINDNEDILPWSLEKGYIKGHQYDSVPVRAQKGIIVSANVYLNKMNALNLCSSVGNVFSYYFHLPNEIMMWNSHQEQYVEFGRKKDVILTAKSYTIDEGMTKFPPKIRGCYLNGEKSLKFFKTYTKALCELECMTNYTLSKCGCVKFSMPRTPSTPVCNVSKASCYLDAMNSWPSYESANDKFEATCRCLKSCNDIKYEVKFEKVSALENVNFVFEVYNISKESAVSRITFMFDEFEILEYEEYATYKLHNFIADVGGVLGLFLGCSLLSLIELIFFLNNFLIYKVKSRQSAGKNRNEDNYPKNLEVKEVSSNRVYIVPSRLYSKGKHSITLPNY